MAAIPHQLLANQLDLLHSILPPDTIIHVGAGNGAGCAQQWLKWQPQHAVIIDADASRLNWVHQQAESHPEWTVVEAVLGREDGEADYHLASNRNEDGLIAPEALTPLWPNLRTIETVKKSIRRLDSLLQTDYQEILNDSRCIWAIIESLPGLSVLQGAGQELDRWSVVWVRVLLSAAPQPELDNATLAAVEAYLAMHGFNCALVVEGNHPAVGEAIFVRDWRHVLTSQLTEQQTHFDQAVKTKDEQTKLAADRQAQISELTKARDEQAKLAAERQTQLEQRTKERDEAIKALAERQAQLDQAVKTKDEQTKLASDCQSQISELTKARDEQVQLAVERQAQLEQRTQERDEATKVLAERQAQLDQSMRTKDELTKLANDCQIQLDQAVQTNDEQTKLANDRQMQVEQLTKTKDEQTKLANDRLTAIQKLTQERDEAIKAKEERQAQLEQAQQAKDQQGKLAADRQAQIEQLTKARDEQAKLAADRQNQLDQAVQTKDEQTKLANDRQMQIEQLTKTKDEQTKLTNDCQMQLDQAMKSKDEQTKLANDRQATIQKLTQERDEASKQLAERQAKIEELSKARDEQTKLVAERQSQLEQRTKERDEATKALAEKKTQLDQAVQARDEQAKLASDRNTAIQKLTQERDEATRVLAERQAEIQRLSKLSAKQKFGNDANIDDFIDDLTPFFSSRSITYVDIGSFIGEVFLKLYESKKINIREAHLYEPNPDSYQKLKKNISECALPSLHAYNIAISKQSGDMLFSAARSMSKHLDIPFDTDLVTNTFKAQCITLDDLTSTFTDHHINLLKIDVEGNEIDVLMSASNLLKEQRADVIYIEVGFNKDGTQQTYLVNIDILLQDYGYRVFKIYEQTNEWIQDSPLLRRCNVAYMSSKFAQANPYKLTLENHKLRQELAKVKGSSLFQVGSLKSSLPAMR